VKILTILFLLGVVPAQSMDTAGQLKRKSLERKKNLVQQCSNIYDEFVRLEAIMYDKAAMQERIAKEQAAWDKQKLLTKVMNDFSIPIRKVFSEDSTEHVVRVARWIMKAYAHNLPIGIWGFGVTLRWIQNEGTMRSLECTVDAKPEALMAMYDERHMQ
jgi:hypothetical protein